MNSQDVQAARRREQVKEIQRRGRLASWNDYISFSVSKVLGVGGLTIGGAELLTPDLLPLVLAQPAWVAAAGLALLTGKSVIKLITAAGEAVEERKK